MNLRLPITLMFAQLIALGAGVEACSGATPFTNDGDAGDDSEAGTVDAGKRDASRGRDAGHADAWTNPEASTGDGGTSEGDADTTGGDGGVIVPPGPDADIYCGASICTGQFCCGSGLADGGVPANYACQNVGTSCTGVKATCDDMIDCPGKLCCATVSGGHVTRIGCATSCGTGLRVCDPAVASDCASTGGGACVAMPQLPGSNQYFCQ